MVTLLTLLANFFAKLISLLNRARLKCLGIREQLSTTYETEAAGTPIRLYRKFEGTTCLLPLTGILESTEQRLFKILAAHADYILDVGANVGVYSLLAAATRPGAKIIAFEPAPGTAALLRGNIQLNGAGNVTVQQKAVGAEAGELEFYVPGKEHLVSSVSSANPDFTRAWHGEVQRITVPKTSLDAVAREAGLSGRGLVKLDAEYLENEVVRGAEELIARESPVFLCEVQIYEIIVNHMPALAGKVDRDHARKLGEFMSSHGYHFYAIGAEGIMRIDSLYAHPDARNFLFSKVSTPEIFLPYTQPDSLARLMGAV